MKLRLKKILIFLFLLPALFCSFGKEEIHLRIIQTTDIHGEIVPGRFPGFARTASLIETLRNEAGAYHTIYIDCGDLIQGSYAMTFNRGKELIEALNAVKCDVFVPGNHDFEFGSETLLQRLEGFHGTAVLAANLSFRKRPLKKWVMLNRAGLRIAVIGMTHPGLYTWLYGSQIRNVTMIPVEKALDSAMGEIMKEKPDLIILAIHAGDYGALGKRSNGKMLTLASLLRKYPQIQLVFGGHTHKTHYGKRLGWNSVFLQASAHSLGVAVADLYFDSVTHKRLHKGDSRVFSAEKFSELPSVRKILLPLQKRVAAEEDRKAGYTFKTLGPLAEGEDGNNLTELFCRALRKGGRCPVAFHGVNNTYKVSRGVITRKQLFILYPYETPGVVLTLTPEELKKVIEEQHARRSKGNFQAVSGVKYTLNEQGECVSLKGDGNSWNGRTPVRCAFAGYALAGAGERFPYLRDLAATKKAEFLAPVRQLVQSYLATEKFGGDQ